MIYEIIGGIGLIALAVSWLPETYKAVREKKSQMDSKFVELFMVGAVSLAIYSWYKRDAIFFWLNIFILVNLMINMYYKFFAKKKKK
jgi:uncharacterized protein with PQ loop repeat